MLFKFLGNSDAPDWIMSELNTVSLVSSVRIKFILRQVLNLLTGADVDFDEIYRHLADAKLSEGQTRSLLAVLSFIVQNAVRFNVEPEDLAQELQQLGSPISHTSTIVRFYREQRNRLRKHLRGRFQRLSAFPRFGYASEVVLARRDGSALPQGVVRAGFAGPDGSFAFSMTEAQADDLIRELQHAVEAMRLTSK